MARPKTLGKKYDSIYSKIEDYQIRKTLWTIKEWKPKKDNRFQGEYNALIQLRNDIKDRIEKNLDGLLFFSRFLEFASAPPTPINRKQYPELEKNIKVSEFRTLLEKDEVVRKKIQDETQEFIAEILTPDRMGSLLISIFFGDQHASSNTEHEIAEQEYKNYRIIMAELMLNYSITILQRSTEKFLFGELERAREIASFIRKQTTSKTFSTHRMTKSRTKSKT